MKRNGGGRRAEVVDSINLANVLMLLSRSGGGGGGGGEDQYAAAAAAVMSPTSTSSTSCCSGGGAGGGGRVFECKTCSRKFPSFQALGGHRASHKKQKISDDVDELDQGGAHRQGATVVEQKAKVHECSICGLEFAMGQALGGHMRRHRAAAEVDLKSATTTSNGKRVMLDLNQLPPLEEEGGEGMKLGAGLGLGVGLVCR